MNESWLATQPQHPASGAPAWHADLRITLVTGAALLAWDWSGLDLAAARMFGNAQGFAWQQHFVTQTLLHDGGRMLAWALMASLVVAALRRGRPDAPGRAERWQWLGVTLLCLLTVPTLKRLSSTSCPWDLAEFGGVARYVSHWQWGVADGAAGHCFPSGHAVAAFAFFSVYFLWRPYQPARARRWLAAVLLVGTVFGAAQLARGAHYPSHTLWSAWLCWTISAAAGAGLAARRRAAP